jgi:2-phosphosulfolactate phosphatase
VAVAVDVISLVGLRVHAAFTPAEEASAPVGVVVDVLRATSTIAQALASGFERVLCCAEIEDARDLRDRIPGSLVGGERDAVRIEGFDVGASPREFLHAEAETLILSTTNGTAAILEAARHCGTVLLGSLLNLEALVRELRERGEDVAILCAGYKGAFALDDAYCAGRIAEELRGEPADSAVAAMRLAASFGSAEEGLGCSQSARNLRANDLEVDIAWCARESVLEVVPRFSRMLGSAAEVV